MSQPTRSIQRTESELPVGRQVVITGARGSGMRFGWSPEPLLSERARRLGLETNADVRREVAATKRGWSQGSLYHCPYCDRDFTTARAARRHARTRQHLVLRWDIYDWLPGAAEK